MIPSPPVIHLLVQLSLCTVDLSAASDDETDFLAPFLGLTLLDAEDVETPDEAPREYQPPPRAASEPAWTSLLPDLSMSFAYRDTRQLKGTDGFGLRSGFVFLVAASFGAAGGVSLPPTSISNPVGLRRASFTHERAGLETSLVAGSAALPPGEPAVSELQAAAEAAALVHLDDLRGWRSRARAAAWLPELTADYRRNVGEIDTLGIRSDLGIDSHNLEDVTRYGVRASWQLSQLVFSREEVAAAQAAIEVQRGRQELLAHVTQLYFERRRLQAKLASVADREEGSGLALNLAEVTAQLDVLTDGFLSRRLAQRPAPEGEPVAAPAGATR